MAYFISDSLEGGSACGVCVVGRRMKALICCRYFTEGGSAADELAGLRPGVLSEELCTALGIAALAPPPWLARMRALGYPPGWRGETQQQEAADGALHFDDELGALPAADEDDMQLGEVPTSFLLLQSHNVIAT